MSAEGRGRYLGVSEGLDVTEEGEQCIDCLRFGYDPHQDVCLLCGRGQLAPDSDDDDSMADVIPEDWCGESMA